MDAGYKVIFPVEKHLVSGFSEAYPNVSFVPKEFVNIDWNSKLDYEKDGVRYLPIRFAEQILKLPYKDVMKAKYMLYGFDWHDWRNTMPIIDCVKTTELMHLLNVPTEYNLVSKFFGTNSQYKADIKIDNDLPVVEMTTIKGYSIFHWAGVIMHATNIYAASSSILYLLELLELRAKKIVLYARNPIEPHFDNVSYLFTKNYELVI